MEINYDLKGTIFNIQKFSVNDGPGIRTVVFFKGCPLACKWCSNPESQYTKPQVLWDLKKCSRCFHCKDTCPKKVITTLDNHIFIDHVQCDGCGQCVNDCTNNALELKGKTMSVKEVIDVVMQDEVFYEEGNGGMTLSGGELFMQHEFAKELLKAAKEKGLHTCCETTALTSFEIFKDLSQYFNLMIIDVKHYDANKHIEGTKVSNNIPASNIKWAIENGIDVLPRIPVIPEFNDTLEDAKNFIPYLKELGIKKIQLLPFHQFGENKYKLLNTKYYYEDTPSLHKEDLEEYKNILINGGIEAFF